MTDTVQLFKDHKYVLLKDFLPKHTCKVESPCIGVCKLFNEVCKGCKRTTEEVTEWYNYSNKQKQQVLDRIKGLK